MAGRRPGWTMQAAGLLLALTAGTTAAQAEGLRFRRMMPYGEARDVFRQLGYQPYFMPGADICDPNDPRCYPELEYCAKSRTWSCTYTWRRGRAVIEVETRYESPVVAHAECIVNCTPTSRARSGRRTAAATAPPAASDED